MRGIMGICGLRRCAAGEFAGRSLAEDHRAGAAQQRNAGCVRAWPIAAIDRRTQLGRHVECVDRILQADRHAVQRAAARAWANASSGSKFTNALTTPSRAAIRVMQSRVTASQVVSPAAIVLAISIA